MPLDRFFGRHRDRAAIVAVLTVCALILPAIARAQTHHHISLGLGYTKLLSDDLKDDEFGIDFTDAGNGLLSYRYSLNPSVDLCIDSRGTVSTDDLLGVDLTLTCTYFGPGVRWNATSTGPRLFVQGSVLFANEEIEFEEDGTTVSADESGVGFGIFGGVDIPMSKLLSLPIEVHYIYSKPDEDDVSGVGINVSLAFNWGAM